MDTAHISKVNESRLQSFQHRDIISIVDTNNACIDYNCVNCIMCMVVTHEVNTVNSEHHKTITIHYHITQITEIIEQHNSNVFTIRRMIVNNGPMQHICFIMTNILCFICCNCGTQCINMYSV